MLVAQLTPSEVVSWLIQNTTLQLHKSFYAFYVYQRIMCIFFWVS